MNYNKIIHPLTNKKYLIYSSEGKKILKNYILLFKNGSGNGKKPKVFFKLKKGELTKYGYKKVINMTKRARRISLNKAAKKYKKLSLFRKLNALYVLHKNKNKKLASIFLQDRNYIRKKYMNNENICGYKKCLETKVFGEHYCSKHGAICYYKYNKNCLPFHKKINKK
tara:strand:+ start:41 stop:544 length:504 start_codon:yes stop_codon:yes gene_type:complete